MKLNTKRDPIYTHEGGKAKHITVYQALRRSVMSCLLWEDQFYEDGVSIADRICDLVKKNDPKAVSNLAVEAREKLRHVPLLLTRELARGQGNLIGDTLSKVIQRPDELTEFLAIYWKDGRIPLSAQVKKGLARAFTKFNAYQLAKYNRDGKIKLRDALFLCHAKPKDKEQENAWKKLVDGTLESPDTWEVGLSTGGNKNETFTRLLKEKKLGYMALLRNLRNMTDSGVDRQLITQALINGAEKSRALPFRYVAAAIACPQLVREIDEAMQLSLGKQEILHGETHLIVDCSASMDSRMSQKSQMNRFDAAGALAVLLSGICERLRVFAFGTHWTEIAPYKGLSLIETIRRVNVGHVTYLGKTVREIQEKTSCDRMICITDEQAHDNIPDPKGTGYVINVASYKNGVGYGKWIHIDGFSESVIDFIREIEAN